MEGVAQLGAYPKEITTAFFFLFVTRPFKQGSHKVQLCILLQKNNNIIASLSHSLPFRAQTSISSFFSLHLFFWYGMRQESGRSEGDYDQCCQIEGEQFGKRALSMTDFSLSVCLSPFFSIVILLNVKRQLAVCCFLSFFFFQVPISHGLSSVKAHMLKG